MNNIILPSQIEKALSMIVLAGYEGYLVGGAVRDFLLGVNPKDYDITTNASTSDLYEIFKSYRIIETGIKHGTITIHLDNQEIEITTFRGELSSLEEDLKLRDFTINSIAYSPSEGIIDFLNGRVDIEDKLIRINGDSPKRFKEDPLRLLRAIRLSTKYGFEIENQTKEYIFSHLNLLERVSVERIRDEFTKILLMDSIKETINDYLKVFCFIVPELKPLNEFKQENPYHIYDCLEHTLEVVSNVSRNKEIRLAALFHDIAKPICFSIDDKGVGHFYSHEIEGSKITEQILKRLKYDKTTIEIVTKLIEFHDYDIGSSNKRVRKFLSKFGVEYIEELFELKKADIQAQNPVYNDRLEKLNESLKKVKEIIELSECISIKHLEISGKDIIDLGYQPGPFIGEVLNYLLDEVINERVNNNLEDLKECVLNYLKNK